jgi:hemerythrin
MSEPLSPEIQLGVAALDGEHSFQITLLRALKVASRAEDPNEALELIGQLDDFTNMHFLFEETLMIQRGYPEREAHRREHNHLIDELRQLRKAVSSSSQEGTPLEAADAIERWLLRPIRTFDRAFAAFIGPSSRIE